ncbi:CRISPR-associated endoribonuclease Cas6 [Alkalibaculum bacchi]|uniref:CRISPR-associated endoribonuclease Cas6 n=1 Tax=Alkalibaculum bacchi TaxID=645887 RepID=UPI0026F1605D|nr:CRISPR-associated endoribonuclease Cas6 [Alkalibaculum bacchi]
MKYITRFELKNNKIKSDNRGTFVSFFKNAISEYMDGYFYDELYGSGTKRKEICWSIRLNNPKFDRDIIHLGGNNIEMTLKTENQEIALIYFSSLLNMKDKPFNIGNDNQITLKSIRLVREPDIIGDFGIFKILSPICIRLHDRETNRDKYLAYSDEGFELEFRNKIKEDLEFFDKEIDSLIFDFSKLKKVVIPIYGTLISATLGTFFVKGDNKLLNYIKNNGIGSRRSSGMGLIELIF